MNVPIVNNWRILGQLVTLAIESLAVDAKYFGRLRHVSLGKRQHSHDVARLQFVERRQVAGELALVSTAGGLRKEEVAWIDDRIGGQRQRSLDLVLQLADVSREGIAHQFLQRF